MYLNFTELGCSEEPRSFLQKRLTIKFLMRVGLFYIFLVMFSIQLLLAHSGRSQGLDSINVTIELRNENLKKLFKKIEKQTGLMFAYQPQQVDGYKSITLPMETRSVKATLDIALEGTSLGYRQVNNSVIIFSEGEKSQMIENEKLAITVAGKVSDSGGNPIPGVNILVKGSTNGTTTDAEGKYSLVVLEEDAVLVFSFIGYFSQEVAVNERSMIDVVLTEDVQTLEEVVVVGYGTTKKATVTGSIVSTKGEEIMKAPVTNISNSLIGNLPGVSSVQRSGEPGSDGSAILIRGVNTLGNNNPLIVVDGIPGRSLDRIDAISIESITVLKDASAAIYGSQAANGVILITTKRGSTGKPKITVNLNKGFNQPTIIPEMANAAEYATMLNEIDFYSNRAPRNTAEQIQKYRDGSDPWGYPNTDWFAEVLKPWSSQNYMNASMSGGSEHLKYYFSLGSKFQDGFYYNSATYYKQHDFRSNIDGKISDNVNIVFDVSGRLQDNNRATRSANTIFRMLKRADPRMHAYWPDGTPGEDVGEGDNPAIISTDAAGYNRTKEYVLNSNLRLNVKIPWVKNLSLTGTASLDKSFLFGKRWETPWYLYSWDQQSYDANNKPILQKGIKGYTDARLTENTHENQNILLNGLIDYEIALGKNYVKLLAGVESRQGQGNSFNAYRRYFISPALAQLSLGGDSEKNNGGGAYENARLNYFGRVNYNYSEKILVEFVWRYDGSYIFPEKGRYGFFPGVSSGWILSEENFWKEHIPFINDFKLRASWGQTGNDRIDEWQYLSTYAFGGIYVTGDGLQNKALYEARIPNQEITWEVANQTNFGLDAALFDNKISLVLDVYNNKRTQILAYRNASVPASTGLTLPRENIGEVGNKGLEFSIGYHNQTGDFKYNVSLNGGYSKNKILFWDETAGIPEWQRSTVRSIGSELYYEAIGIFKNQAALDSYPHWDGAQPGDIIFKDINDDGKIDGLDKVRHEKSSIPRFTGGMNVNLTYKQFDLSVLFQGASGAIRYLDTESGDIGNYLKYDYVGRWTPENPDADKPRTYNRDDVYWKGNNNKNTQYVLNADYIRLKNFEIGYTLPAAINDKLGINALRIYISGYNLLTFSPGLHDYDPETVTSGIYGGNYMPQRVVNGGLTLGF